MFPRKGNFSKVIERIEKFHILLEELNDIRALFGPLHVELL